MINSILSYPTRNRNYGKSNWRGNCAGEVIRDLLHFYRPNVFVDPAMGSGTSADVVRELNANQKANYPPQIEFFGLDLHSGFNLLKDSLAERIGGQRADYVFFHPPYDGVIKYSGEVWGTQAHPDDLSRCENYEDFLTKMVLAVRNIYDSLKSGAAYSILIGDLRKHGEYTSIQADLLQLMPGKLEGVLIKQQFNCVSDRKNYAHQNFIPIQHEYILNFKNSRLMFGALDCALQTAEKLSRLSRANWKAVISKALQTLGGQAPLGEIYQVIESTAPDKTKTRPNWQARVRAELQNSFRSIERGIWATA